jgi:hypothetical protein
MKPPRIVFYKPRPVSYRGYMIVAWLLWTLFVNAVSIVVFILWAAIWLLWVTLVVLPARLVGKTVGHKRAVSLKRAEAEMRQYQDDK